MSSHPHGHEHGHAHGHPREGHDQHGNPHDRAHYVEKLEASDRAAWQRPDEVVRALKLAAGHTVAEIGAGTGYFVRRIAQAVGERGRVFAVDVDPEILVELRTRVAQAGLGNVTPVLAQPDDPMLPSASCDRVLVVNALHHFPDPAAAFAPLAKLLKPGGQLACLDFHERETAMGPPLEHRLSREACLDAAKAAGLELVDEPTFLEHQYFLVLEHRS